MARRITEVEQKQASGGTWQDPYDQPCFTTYAHENSGSNGFYSFTHRLDKHSFTFGGNDHYGMYLSLIHI